VLQSAIRDLLTRWYDVSDWCRHIPWYWLITTCHVSQVRCGDCVGFCWSCGCWCVRL